MRFLDASVLVKAYLDEPGSLRVRDWLVQQGCAVARLAEVEVTSALARKVREGSVAAEHVARLRKELDADLAEMHVLELTTEAVQTAKAVLVRHPLRAGDALQLASALVLRAAVPAGFTFACVDDRLAAAAVREGLAVEAP